MSINILNEQINKRVIYEDDNYELYLPYNISSICSMVPQWCEDKEIKKRVIDAFKQSHVTYILTGKKDNFSTILMDNGSKVPLRLSGKYYMFNPITQMSIWPQIQNIKKYFSDKPGLIDKLNLQYTLKDRLKYEMPFSKEEMINFSKKNEFAKTIYDQIQGVLPAFRDGKDIWIEIWEKFEGSDKVDVYDRSWLFEDMKNGELGIMPDHDGVTVFVEEEYYKEKFLDLSEDDDWVYASAMHGAGYYDDCEELETEELNYINNYLTPENRTKLQELREMVGVPRFNEEELVHEEGLIMDFLEQFFPKEAEKFGYDWLDSLGCALSRGRRDAMRKEIENEIVIEYNDHGNVTEMFITWPQLLQIVGQNNIETWEGLAEIELNRLPSLYDGWWDTWEVDDEGEKDLNDDFSRFVDKINEIGWEKIKELQTKRENFVKTVEELGFKKHSGWVSGIQNAYSKVIPNAKGPGKEYMIYVGEYNPEDDTVRTREEIEATPKTIEMGFDEFVEKQSNLEDTEKEVNENYTSKIINSIISNIIKENVHK